MRGRDHGMNLTDWKPPTDSVNLSYREWLELARKHGKGDGEHWYFRVGDANNKVTMTRVIVLSSSMVPLEKRLVSIVSTMA